MKERLQELKQSLSGEFHTDYKTRILYATDASAYREIPLAVAYPASDDDLRKLIQFAHKFKVGLIPRTAGTSLAGQVVGGGIVVDVSRTMNQILELNEEEGWVRVQPGVIRDELNVFLKPFGLYFGPETSTANRAMIGGMVGNNSCGSNSVVYGSTREHTLEIEGLLSNGEPAVFSEVDAQTFEEKLALQSLEGEIYRGVYQLLNKEEVKAEIIKEYPKESIKRRNTGYAIDLLIRQQPFNPSGTNFNFCTLLAGSEGTLFFSTAIKLKVGPLPPPNVGLLCVHFDSIDEALKANLIGLKYNISASELIDHYILDCTKNNAEQQKNRFFVEGEPQAILVFEFARETLQEVERDTDQCIAELKELQLGYHYPVLYGADVKKIWNLRKAGLGLLGNVPGDDKAVPVIEDTAVDVRDLPAYIEEFNHILKKYDLYAVHYAHAGSGELHLRPIINLKTEEGNAMFRTIAREIAALVKKYRGSLSGEHGDGRLRGEFIQDMIGERNYQLLIQLKHLWDPNNIFNPNKIVHTPPMNSSLRYEAGREKHHFDTVFRYYDQDVLQHAEQCNGSAECRKTEVTGGVMCPSYMATKNESDSTRARANILREYLTHSDKINRFDHHEIMEVMDLCLSCKGCKTECPSSVDVAKLKAEFTQHYYDANGVPFRSAMIARFTQLNKLASLAPWLYNGLTQGKLTSGFIKSISGFHTKRSMPRLANRSLERDLLKRKQTPQKHKVYLFCDEFTNYNDAAIGGKAVDLLQSLGYEVIYSKHRESGRTWLSKGMVRHAAELAKANVEHFAPLVDINTPLIGIEPSAILTFRDEYIDLVPQDLYDQAVELSKNVFTIEEFIFREHKAGRIQSSQFHAQQQKFLLHGHCHQKALTGTAHLKEILTIPVGHEVDEIPSGCCGMAGSFGYEKEHYDISMKIGSLVLFPAVENRSEHTRVVASGTSCRHQIHDGTKVHAYHPIEVLWESVK